MVDPKSYADDSHQLLVDSVDLPVLRALLELHRPSRAGSLSVIEVDGRRHGLYEPHCLGCNYQGNSFIDAEWPCETVRLIAMDLGVVLPAPDFG